MNKEKGKWCGFLIGTIRSVYSFGNDTDENEGASSQPAGPPPPASLIVCYIHASSLRKRYILKKMTNINISMQDERIAGEIITSTKVFPDSPLRPLPDVLLKV